MDDAGQHNKDSDLAGTRGASPAGDKVDPVSAGPTVSDTIAGRAINAGGTSDLSNRGDGREAPVGGSQRGGADTKQGGVTGTSGQPESSSHQGPENQRGDQNP